MLYEDRTPEDDSLTKCRTFSFFVPSDLDLSPLTLTFKLDNATNRKFHHPPFNHSEVIMLTNKQTDKLTNKHAAENIHLTPLCYAGG